MTGIVTTGWQYAEYIPAGDPRHPQYQPPHVCGVECVHNQAALKRRPCPSDHPHERHSWNAWPVEATWFLCMGRSNATEEGMTCAASSHQG